MSDTSKLCTACGKWAPDGVRVREPDGTIWWVHNNETCTEGAEVMPMTDNTPTRADLMNLETVICGIISTIDFIPSDRHPTLCMPWASRIRTLLEEQWYAGQNVPEG